MREGRSVSRRRRRRIPTPPEQPRLVFPRHRHVVCFSGGHSSALVAIEVVRRYGREGVVLLNHDISAAVEDADINRFKCEVADYIGIPITYASFCDQSGKIPDQFDVCVAEKAFKTGHDKVLCTDRLKTRPFGEWPKVAECASSDENQKPCECVI